ncbi:MAG: Uma2 family endonuclease [Acidobacteria bacterium]|nr:Uma2 family endonuclease [Acidobacteriota bacterium]
MPHITTRHPLPSEPQHTRRAPATAGSEPPPEFPGCDPVSLPTWDDVWAYEGRIEYWSAENGTAWVLRDAGPIHETAPNLLSELLTRLGQERGSRIRCAGAVYLMERDAAGRPRQVLVADQTIYLDRSTWRPRDPAIVLGVTPLPDVILEVDHTTDVRRNKLPVYEAWGFPEVWVDTPDLPSPSRPRRVRPGLTIYVLEEGRFRTADESLAFPTWTALQIHAALNESRLGPRTLADLTRVGRRLGEREGTTPDDDPQLGRHRRQARDAGLAEGVARERALLGRLAARKFGPLTAERLAGLIAGVANPEHLAGVGDLIIDCDDGDDVLSRLGSR